MSRESWEDEADDWAAANPKEAQEITDLVKPSRLCITCKRPVFDGGVLCDCCRGGGPSFDNPVAMWDSHVRQAQQFVDCATPGDSDL